MKKGLELKLMRTLNTSRLSPSQETLARDPCSAFPLAHLENGVIFKLGGTWVQDSAWDQGVR